MSLRSKVTVPLQVRKAVGPNVRVGSDFRCGKRCTLWAPRGLRVGFEVRLGSDVRIEADGTIGDCVLIANGTAIVGRTDHRINQIGVPVTRSTSVHRDPQALSLPTHIGSDVWIGYGSLILSGVTIGDSSIIGAGSLVTGDVPPNTIVAGRPARVVRKRFDAPDDLQRHWDALAEAGVTLQRSAL